MSYRHSLLISDGPNGGGVSPHAFIPAIKSKGSSSTYIDVGYSTGCAFGDPLALGCPNVVDMLCEFGLTFESIVLSTLSVRGTSCSDDALSWILHLSQMRRYSSKYCWGPYCKP